MDSNASHRESAVCPRCGAPVSRHSLRGLCGRCIARGVLAVSPTDPPADTGLRVRCPQCGRAIELAEGAGLSDIRCDSCGTHFRIADEEAATQAAATFGRVGQFEILEKLGTGAFGTVWKARDTKLDRLVAVKIPHQRHPTAPALEKFLREARAAAQLRHPNIVSVFEVGREEDLVYIVGDYVEGVSLADWLTGKRLSAREAARLCRKIASALEHAHEQGVIHRDIKPGNILLDPKGEPHLTDFGLARREAGEVTMTLDGQLLGTPAYMSPQQARGEAHQADHRTDIYSLGVVFFQLLTGELPFRGNARMLMHQVIHDEPPSPRKLNGQVPRDLETICLKCLEKEPARRYESARVLGEELDRFLSGEPIQARPLGQLGKAWRWCRRKPALATATGAAAALLLTVAVVSTVSAIRIAASRRAEERESYYALIGLAQSLVDQGEIDRAKEALLKCPPRYRHWEWGHLLFRCHQDILSIPAHPEAIFDARLQERSPTDQPQKVIFNHDGSQLASLGRDGSVKVWDAKEGHRLIAFGGTDCPATTVVFSPRSPQLAVAFTNGVVEVRDASVWRKQWDSRLETGKAGQLIYRPDGNRLVLCGGMEIRIYDVATGTMVGHQHTEGRIKSVAFVSAGAQLLAQTDKGVHLFDADGRTDRGMVSVPSVDGGSLFIGPNAHRFVTINPARMVALWTNSTVRVDLAEIRGAQPSAVRRVFFSGDGRRFCTGGELGSARVWDAESGKELLVIPSKVHLAVFSPDGNRLVTTGTDWIARLWDLKDRVELLQLRGHSSSIQSVAFSPDGSQLATLAQDGILKLWSPETGREVLREPLWVWGLAVSPDGWRIASSSGVEEFTIWDAASGHRALRVDTRVHDTCGSVFSLDGRQLVTVGWDDLGRVWDVESGRLLFNLEGHTRTVRAVAYAPSGKQIATASRDGTARIWETGTGRQIHCLDHGSNLVSHVAFSPDSSRLATASTLGLRMWDAESGRLLLEVRKEGSPLWRAIFSPDGKRLALIYTTEPAVQICDAKTGTVLSTWSTGIAWNGAFSGDGKRFLVAVPGYDIVYGLAEANAQLWDCETGRRILLLKGHSEPFNEILFTADDQRVLSSSFDMTVRQWETFPWREADYPGVAGGSFQGRTRRFADEYWRKRLAAEAQPPREVRSRTESTMLWPGRDAGATTAQIDLTEHYNGVLQTWLGPCFRAEDADNSLRDLGCGLLELGSVRFDVRGVVGLRYRSDAASAFAGIPLFFPLSTDGIRVARKVRYLHVLHATYPAEKDGAEIARFVWHYDDGQEESAILYGKDVRDWWWRPEDPVSPTSDRSRVVWTGSNPVAREKGYQLRLYLTTIENPRPQEMVRTLDYVSAMSASAPFLIALTVE